MASIYPSHRRLAEFLKAIVILAMVLSIATHSFAEEKTVASGQPVLPNNLTELLALSSTQLDQCDVARMNLLCAEGLPGAESMDVQVCLDTLDRWARHVEDETIRNYHRFIEHPKDYSNSRDVYRMMMLTTVLREDFRAH